MPDIPRMPEGELTYGTVPAGSVFASADPIPPTIAIQGDSGQALVSIHPNGTLEYGEGYDPDDAARRFWDALRTLAPAPTRYVLGIGEIEAQVAAVRALHQPITDRTGWDGSGGYDAVSPACATCGSEDNAVAWPCPTIRALDGVDQEGRPS